MRNSLPPFKNVINSHLEPIHLHLARTVFFEEDGLEIPILGEQLNRVTGNKMFFNLNYTLDSEEEVIPLQKITEIMNNKKPLIVSVIFENRLGDEMYESKMFGLKFTNILNGSDFNWADRGLKELIVEFDFTENSFKFKKEQSIF